MMDKNKYCVIMAGGVGSRFWPVSRNSKPKQFLDILGVGSTFIQQTFNRFAKIIPIENILVVTAEMYYDLVKEQLPQMLDENILLEPHKRNTAPCIAYATYKLLKKNPNAEVVVAPSDHLILDEDLFLSTVNQALDYVAQNNELVTIGIKPTRPETGYGYIQANRMEYKAVGDMVAYKVKTFTEKPNLELAKVLVASGEFCWNSGIFVWNVQTIAQELERYIPDIANLFKDGMPFYFTPDEKNYIKEVYEGCNGISIDYAVMEKTEKSWVVAAKFGWSDLGTWDSLYDRNSKDENGNMVDVQKSMLSDVSNSLIVSTQKDKLIVVKGLENYMVVSTNDVLLVCPRDAVEFKNVITDLAVNELSDYQ